MSREGYGSAAATLPSIAEGLRVEGLGFRVYCHDASIDRIRPRTHAIFTYTRMYVRTYTSTRAHKQSSAWNGCSCEHRCNARAFCQGRL